MQIELNENEAQVLINLLNVAVKSVGLEASESALFFVKKIKDAAETEKNLALPQTAPPMMAEAAE